MAINEEEELILHQNNTPCHELLKTMAKLHELGFEFLSHWRYSPELFLIDY